MELEEIEEEGKIHCGHRLLNEPRNAAIGGLAHEFAHLLLGHTGRGSLEHESQAHKLASSGELRMKQRSCTDVLAF